jgi:hypothetical protein
MAMPHPHRVFHGTLGGAALSILAEGIRVAQGEPSFTDDLSLACCKYAHEGYNTNRFYAGQTLAAARELAAQELIASTEDDAALLANARAYWDRYSTEGAVFFIRTGRWHVGVGPTAYLEFDMRRREVRGGLTKWIEGHIALYHEASDLVRLRQRLGDDMSRIASIPRDIVHIPSDDIVMRLPSIPPVRQSLASLARQAVGLESNRPETWHEVLEAIENLTNAPTLTRPTDTLSNQLRLARVQTAVRRGYLSILRARGFRMIKADYIEPYEEDDHVFWAPDEIEARLEALVGANPDYELAQAMRALWHTGRLDVGRVLDLYRATAPRWT